jgi:hypothetical protein
MIFQVLIIATPRANITHDIALRHVFFLPGLCEDEDSNAKAHGNFKDIIYNVFSLKCQMMNEFWTTHNTCMETNIETT